MHFKDRSSVSEMSEFSTYCSGALGQMCPCKVNIMRHQNIAFSFHFKCWKDELLMNTTDTHTHAHTLWRLISHLLLERKQATSSLKGQMLMFLGFLTYEFNWQSPGTLWRLSKGLSCVYKILDVPMHQPSLDHSHYIWMHNFSSFIVKTWIQPSKNLQGNGQINISIIMNLQP